MHHFEKAGDEAEKPPGNERDHENGAYGPENAHPLSQKLFRVVPFLKRVPVLGLSLQAFGPRLVTAIGVERLFAKGLSHGFLSLSIQPMLTERYGLTGAMYQRLSSLYMLGWSVNSLFTAITDTFAVFGYTKRWYSVFCGVGSGVFALLYALLPAKESSAQPAAAFLFLIALFLVMIDVFAQSIYSRRIRRSPAGGAALVSWAWNATLFGIVISSAVQGPLSDNNLTRVGVFITAGLLFVIALLFTVNLIGEHPNRIARVEDAKADYILQQREEREWRRAEQLMGSDLSLAKGEAPVATCEPVTPVEGEEEEEGEYDELAGFVAPKVKSVLWGAIEINLEVVRRNWRMMIYCCVLTAAVAVTAAVTILGTNWQLLWTCIAVTIVLCGAGFITLPLVVAKTAVFMYFNYTFNLSIPGVLNTFYVAPPECLPNGPHFSYTFFNLINGIVGNVFGILGVTFFAHFLHNFSYRAVMGASAILIPIASLFDLIMLMRWNVYIGIPDHAMYIFGDGVVFFAVQTITSMPLVLLTSHVAPRGSETMVLSILNSVAYVGSSTSAAIGYLLMETIWPVITMGECDFSNAPWIVIAGHLALPLLILPLAYLLLPSARMCATLNALGEEVSLRAGHDSEHAASTSRSESDSCGVAELSRVSVEEPRKPSQTRQA